MPKPCPPLFLHLRIFMDSGHMSIYFLSTFSVSSDYNSYVPSEPKRFEGRKIRRFWSRKKSVQVHTVLLWNNLNFVGCFLIKHLKFYSLLLETRILSIEYCHFFLDWGRQKNKISRASFARFNFTYCYKLKIFYFWVNMGHMKSNYWRQA